MNNKDIIQKKIAQWQDKRQANWTLPQDCYIDADSHTADLQLFRRSWVYVATLAELKDQGDYLVVTIGEDSVILIRNLADEIKAFHNVCCHRGSQVLRDKKGSCANIVCHYHQWTYNLEGKLIYAGNMGEGFDIEPFQLQLVKVEIVSGMIFICMSDAPPLNDIQKMRELLEPYIGVYDIQKMKVAFIEESIREANWKLAVENNRECFHCECNHPELTYPLYAEGFGLQIDEDSELTQEHADYLALVERKTVEWENLGVEYAEKAFEDDVWARVVRLPLANNSVSHTVDGKPACSKLFPPFSQPESSAVSVWLYPSSWSHFLNDYVMYATVLPINENRCYIKTVWLVREDAEEGKDYNLEHLKKVWVETNKQDARLFESVMVGIKSSAYKEGPFAAQEAFLDHFTSWYLQTVEQANT